MHVLIELIIEVFAAIIEGISVRSWKGCLTVLISIAALVGIFLYLYY